MGSDAVVDLSHYTVAASQHGWLEKIQNTSQGIRGIALDGEKQLVRGAAHEADHHS